ncbi:uncharacterized protein LOC108200876 [Daucus carota subsp. sativus]|uniref:uncharacterized protein LOC108200876 n=1 Tax=Daucus carota subsp. sativus TaxID=79200 RepID=UPI0030830608
MHLFQNMHKEYKGLALRRLLWKAARATTLSEFNLHMNQMKEVSPNCYEWLMQKPREQWSRSAFRTTSHSDMFVNNHCEVFNSSLSKLRDLHIITMFRELHKTIMKRIQIRRDKMITTNAVICPSAHKKLTKSIHYAGNCVVTWSGGSSYSVTSSDGGHELVVNLLKRTCACRKWDLTGLPCYHACACIALRNEPWENYIHDCYKKETYLQKSDEATKAAAEGREINVGKSKVKCKNCNQEGHNSRTCKMQKAPTNRSRSETYERECLGVGNKVGGAKKAP